MLFFFCYIRTVTVWIFLPASQGRGRVENWPQPSRCVIQTVILESEFVLVNFPSEMTMLVFHSVVSKI